MMMMISALGKKKEISSDERKKSSLDIINKHNERF